MNKKHILPKGAVGSTGFTLIEVLVASFILFLVIASVTLVYRGALLSSNKAERSLRFIALVEPISEQIRFQLRTANQASLNGSGSMGEVNYEWSASHLAQGQSLAVVDSETGAATTNGRAFYLWTINLELKLGNARRNFEFNEVSW